MHIERAYDNLRRVKERLHREKRRSEKVCTVTARIDNSSLGLRVSAFDQLAIASTL